MTDILLVDDEPSLLDLEKKILEIKYGYSVITAESAKEALSLLQNNSFDAVVSDYSMPEMDGIALLRVIREHYGQIPFILFTVHEREGVVIEALNAGANFYVQKEEHPTIAFAELSHKINRSIDLFRSKTNLRIQRDLALACANAKSTTETLSYCIRAVLDVSRLSAAAVYINEENTLHLAAAEGFSYKYHEKQIQENILTYLCASLRDGSIFRDEADIKSSSPALWNIEKIRSEVVLRMVHHQNVIGLIHLASRSNSFEFKDSTKLFIEDVLIQIAGHIADRLSEDALRESERRMSTLIKNLPGMVYVGKGDDLRTMEYVSNGCYAITGYTAEEITRAPLNSWDLLIHPPDRERTAEIIRRALKKRAQYRVTYRLKTKDNKFRWVLDQGIGVFDSDGSLFILEGFVIDITRQKFLDDQVRINQNRLNMLFSHMNTGCAIFRETKETRDGILIEINSAAERLEGKEKSDLIGETFRSLFANPSALPLIKAFEGLIGDGKPRTLPMIPFDLITGRRFREAYLYSSPAAIGKNEKEIFLLYSDITDKVTSQDQIISSLKEKELLLKEVHHRVKNNLQIISGILKLQSYRISDPIAQEILQECRNQVFSMASIHELLYNSRDIARIKIDDYINKLLDHLRQEYGSAIEPIMFSLSIDPSIVLDVERCIPCGLVLNELITNAVKYAFEPGKGGEIEVSFTLTDGWYEMIIRDNGRGLPKDFDIRMSKSLGMELITRLAHQMLSLIHI